MRRIAEDPRPGQEVGVRLACVDHRLHLCVGNQGLFDDLRRQHGPVGRRRRCDRGHGSRFNERGGVGRGLGEADAAEGIGLVEADVMALARPGAGLVRNRRGSREEGQPVGGRGQGAGPGRQDGGVADGPELSRLGGRTSGDAGRRDRGLRQRLGEDHRRNELDRVPAIDQEEASLDRGPVLGVGPLREDQSKDDLPAGGQRAQRRRVIEQPGWNDRREPPAVGEAVQGRVQVRLQLLERRVGENDMEAARARQDIAQMLGVVPAVRGGREQAVQHRAAATGQFIEGEARATGFRQDGQQARTGGRLQHLVARPHLGGQDRQRAQVRRRGELVQRYLLLAAPGVGQAEVSEVGQEGDDLGRCVLQPGDLRGQAAQLKDHGRFDGVIGVPPDPGAVGVRSPEGGGHDAGHQPPVQRPRAVEMRREGPGGGEQVGGAVGRRGGGEQGQKGVHGGRSVSPAAKGASLQSRRARPSAPCLPPSTVDQRGTRLSRLAFSTCIISALIRRNRAGGM